MTYAKPLSKEDIFAQAKSGTLEARAIIPNRKSAQGTMTPTLNPFDNSVIGHVEFCDAEVVNEAVAVARDTFEKGTWSRMSPYDRKLVIQKWARLIDEHAEELAALECKDVGKPLKECIGFDLPDTSYTIAWFAEAADKVFGKVSPSPGNNLGMVVKEPMGVVGAVLPWNFPATIFAWKVAPALAAGNSIIVKPAEQTSLSTYRMVQLAHQAGIPEGALLLVTGLGEATGKPLGLHNEVDVVSFTGSTEVGRYFLHYSADSNLKEIVLECGGKSPQVIFEDTYPMDEVVDQILDAAFYNMGENCSCGSRLLVQESIKDEVLKAIVAKLPEWKIGDPADMSVFMGPMIEEGHFRKVLAHIEASKKEGATLIYGGKAVDAGAGKCIEPTIFDNVTPEMSLFNDEVFGPVLAVTTFKTEEEAIELANATKYGLASSIYTSDIRRAHRVSQRIKAGTVSVNCFSEGDIGTPFGGYKMSGFGGRDKGFEALEQYMATKTIWYEN
ncbi:aldehyde dehydrogenase [Desulfoluna spongiiphila]|uniref:aldehyde dehydrogenase n=1 Tax=Desulfoluna spongiiphila TaxID=419481 RepID=UPI00125F1DC5|nr:aldehyde dehydrogenase [Desulfoluna spongiiphila]